MKLFSSAGRLLYGRAGRASMMDRNDFDRILRAHKSTVSRYCYALCKNKADADELFQETFCKVLTSDFTPSDDNATLTYLIKACTNCFKDVYRKQKNGTSSRLTKRKRTCPPSTPKAKILSDIPL